MKHFAVYGASLYIGLIKLNLWHGCIKWSRKMIICIVLSVFHVIAPLNGRDCTWMGTKVCPWIWNSKTSGVPNDSAQCKQKLIKALADQWSSAM